MLTTKTDLWHWMTLGVACALTGCGSGVGTPGGDKDDQQQQEQVVFTEDADPALAALPFIEDELLVQPYPGADAETLEGLFAEVGAVIIDELADIEVTVLEVPPDRFDLIAAQLGESGLIETVQKNYLYEPGELPDDPMFTRQTHLSQIHAPDAWETTVGAKEVIIAIVDTGVDSDHPDLAAKIIDGWNAYDNNADYSDVQGHGTIVAGVAAAASNNGMGVAGVAWESPLLAIRATDESGRSSARHLAAGILWAVQHDASVINVSFAPLWSNRVVRAAAQQALHRGSLVVISSGNGGGTTIAQGYSEALFVGAISASDSIASFSDCGPFVDLVAPGVAVRSTKRGGGYGTANGTSFAAPIVSGVAALAWSVNPDLRPVSIVNVILDNAVDLGSVGKDSTYGYGAVDAAAAIDAATQASFVPDTTPPSLKVDRPSNGAVLSGRYATIVTASDRWGVADVALSVDGVSYATDTRAPYRFVIDTRRFPDGPHELSFVATDATGNASTQKTVIVTFRYSSGSVSGSTTAITFTSPADGATVSRDVNIQANVSDSDGLAFVEWFVDGNSVLVSPVSGRSSGVSYLWRTAGVAAGPHTIALVVTDAGGNVTTGQLDINRR